MLLTLSPDSPEPLYEQIRRGITALIAQGHLRDGQRLDSVRQVAAEFGINPATVKKAYDQLVRDGLVETAGRSGSVVRQGTRTAQQREQLRADLQELIQRARAQGFTTSEIAKLIKEL
ncbi:GntR family transcriptional regulator [Corynebacterium lizhenjunii]|uniref:GntR family transcriptional regulator n=1 Tax=Corynebacterium lizhenjunii TaxID=2709394 RepID=A0A7T0KFM1_9CORY|nr:GntR family transcriptional regulator [Corynebacterium lizhenjunii]QPK79420.1 GntR family transcriptional regulator [Corynebacterium lizhenjunii]